MSSSALAGGGEPVFLLHCGVFCFVPSLHPASWSPNFLPEPAPCGREAVLGQARKRLSPCSVGAGRMCASLSCSGTHHPASANQEPGCVQPLSSLFK